MALSDTELTTMLRGIARTQAKLYYKPEIPDPPVTVVKSVFMLILAIVTIEFLYAGVTEERLNDLEGIPGEVANEMKAVGWKFDDMIAPFNGEP